MLAVRLYPLSKDVGNDKRLYPTEKERHDRCLRRVAMPDLPRGLGRSIPKSQASLRDQGNARMRPVVTGCAPATSIRSYGCRRRRRTRRCARCFPRGRGKQHPGRVRSPEQKPKGTAEANIGFHGPLSVLKKTVAPGGCSPAKGNGWMINYRSPRARAGRTPGSRQHR
jgi:hypothetical protein